MCAALLVALQSAAACRQADARDPAADSRRATHLMRDLGCAGCHTIPGVPGAKGVVGPPLWAYADRAYVAGVLPNTPANLERWILEPRSVNPRTAMPAVRMTDEDARAIAAYLHTLYAQPVAVRMLHGFVERAVGRAVAQPPPPRERVD